jgi:tetratricopeptide (TPR) repeat protein
MRRTFLRINLIIVFGLLSIARVGVAQNLPAAAPQSSPPEISNASSLDEDSVERLVSQLDAAIAARYPNALKFYGLESLAQKYSILSSHTQITHLATAPGGALVRATYEITGKTSQTANSSTLKTSSLEFWLTRTNDGFAFSQKMWTPPAEAEDLLANTGLQAWQESSTGILQLIAERKGGRWIPLRQMRWNGSLASKAVLSQLESAQQITPQAPMDTLWLQRQLDRYTSDGAGTVHLFFQGGNDGWVGVGSAWQANPLQTTDPNGQLEALRKNVNAAGFTSASAHRDFGKTLADAGLYVEASNQLQQASALSPASVDPDYLARIDNLRSRDPELLAATQLQNEARIGLDPTHPTYQINALSQQFSRDPSPLTALRLGDEYSKLGDDDRASQMLQRAQNLLADNDADGLSTSDQAWMKVLFDHLQERIRNSALKPPNIIRSSLFTVRCWTDDPNSLSLLAALEAAQHTVYADFNIPMNNTEVLLWPTQADFQRYTTRFSATADSEFVTALTLTKLIGTAQGPVVLSEEMNIYSSRDTTWFSTVAHEYGHVAVRQMSKARDVPTWLNEGIACAVQGGYDGYKPRIHTAAQNGSLLSMDDMLQWQVDGERAFLAYSEANSMVDYIVDHWGGNALLQILRLIGSDTPPDDAFSMTLQLNQHQLWQQWRQNGVQ